MARNMSQTMPSMENSPDVTIVIACYNEHRVFDQSLAEIRKIIAYTGGVYEIIFVDDVSSDDTRGRILGAVNSFPNVRAIFHDKNTGRGRTVTDGIRESKASVVGFIDFDLATPAWYIPEIVSRVRNGADIVLARRVYKLSPGILHRWILSRGYHYLMRAMLGVSLGDTESGCKFFNREKILPILEEIKDPHWFWDTELCVRSALKGLKIVEVPTLYIRRPETGSTVKIVRDSWNYFKNLLWFRKEVQRIRGHQLAKSSIRGSKVL